MIEDKASDHNAPSDTEDKTIHRYTCPVCSQDIPITQKVCPHCNLRLDGSIATHQLDRLPSEGKPLDLEPHPSDAYALGSSVFKPEMRLRIEIPGQKQSIRLHFAPNQDLILGRIVPEEMSENVLDLSPYAAYQLGVSRCHAAMRLRNQALELRDLVSSNGTYVNEQRLMPGEIYRLCSGDVVRLGRLRLVLHFEPQL